MNIAKDNFHSFVSVDEQPKKIYQIEKTKPTGGFGFCACKRLFDIVFALIFGIVMLPAMLIIALCIKIESPGKALFIQERLGKDGKTFRMLKKDRENR